MEYTVHLCVPVSQAGCSLGFKVGTKWVPQRNGVGFRAVAKNSEIVTMWYTGRQLPVARGTGTNEAFVRDCQPNDVSHSCHEFRSPREIR